MIVVSRIHNTVTTCSMYDDVGEKMAVNSRRAAEPAESATKIVSNFFQNGGQFERLFNNQIYGINYKKQRFLGFLEAWLQDHEENEFFEVIC